MSDRRTAPADWVVPAILVGVGIGVFLAVGLIIVLTANDRIEPEGLVHELEVYTSCLADHGANVPIVEASRDGGFTVTVPGSLVEGEIDTTVWREAHDRCSDVAPDIYDVLLGGLPGGLLGGFPGGLMHGFPEGVLEGL
jgi:hypothetical protein